MTVTPYSHVLYTKMVQNARRFVSTILRNRGGGGGGGGGEGYSSAHAHVITCDPLPVIRVACRVRMESSEDVFSCRNCSKARPHVSR